MKGVRGERLGTHRAVCPVGKAGGAARWAIRTVRLSQTGDSGLDPGSEAAASV